MSSFRNKLLLGLVATGLLISIAASNGQTIFSGVSSVFGRTGAVIAQIGDYAFSQISGTVGCTQIPHLTGDTTSSGTCATITTKTNGVSFAPSATTDTTNATNITSGTLPAAQLPNPSATTLGGVKSLATITHQWLASIGTNGTPTQTQPAFTDISGSVAATQMPALTGDITTSAGTVATTLKNTGIGAGSCTACSVSVDAAGRVTTYATGASGSSTFTPISTQTATSGVTTSLAWTALGSTYEDYFIDCRGIQPDTNGDIFALVMGTGVGPTYQITGYLSEYVYVKAGVNGFGDNVTTAYIPLTDNTQGVVNPANSANDAMALKIWVHSIPSSTVFKPVIITGSYSTTSGTMLTFNGTGEWHGAATAVTAMKIQTTGGVHTFAGKCTLSGMSP